MSMAWNPDREPFSAASLIVGESEPMMELKHLVRQVAKSSASILITGPSGAGKEVVARAIHAESSRGGQNYVAVNCGAIPRELMESELFGHEKGSFTGAVSQRRGRFEEAHGGTLFLDEIGDMPADMQVKLLRVLEERSVQRVGGRGEIAVDTRIISATHRNLDQAIEKQTFREDLFYRLAVFPIEIPALNERAEDVPLLIRHFLKQMPDQRGAVRFNPQALQRLVAHPWPGNVRELRNVVERSAILYSGKTVGAEEVELLLERRPRNRITGSASTKLGTALACDLPRGEVVADAKPAVAEVAAPIPALPAAIDISGGLEAGGTIDLRSMMNEMERNLIAEALRLSEGVVTEASRLLSLQRTTLVEKMRRHGMSKAA